MQAKSGLLTNLKKDAAYAVLSFFERTTLMLGALLSAGFYMIPWWASEDPSTGTFIMSLFGALAVVLAFGKVRYAADALERSFMLDGGVWDVLVGVMFGLICFLALVLCSFLTGAISYILGAWFMHIMIGIYLLIPGFVMALAIGARTSEKLFWHQRLGQSVYNGSKGLREHLNRVVNDKDGD